MFIMFTYYIFSDAKEHINCPERIFASDNDIITYTLKTELNAEHRFLDCDCSGESPTFTFIHTSLARGKHKRKSRKNHRKVGKKVKSKKNKRM